MKPSIQIWNRRLTSADLGWAVISIATLALGFAIAWAVKDSVKLQKVAQLIPDDVAAYIAQEQARTSSPVYPHEKVIYREVEPGVQLRAEPGTAHVTGTIERIDTYRDFGTINMKLAELVHDPDAAEQAAIEAGQCTISRAEEESCTPNGFFVRRTDVRLALPLAKDATIAVTPYHQFSDPALGGEPGDGFIEIPLSTLRKIFEKEEYFSTTPFHFTTKDGAIVRMEEQYLP